jgi:hypothetical protein
METTLMARIRTVKPEFFTSEDIISLSPFARLLYIGMWCEADREGRFAWKPNTLKLRYFPADNIEIYSLCDEIVAAGLVVTYGDGLAFIPSFSKHQSINPREAASTFPAPVEYSNNYSPRVTDASLTVTDMQRGRKEGKESICSSDDEQTSEGFEQFWSAYPKKQAKQDAAKAFRSAKLKPEQLQTVLQDITSRKSSAEWLKDGGKFIPLPATYIRGKRWEDEQVTTAIHVDERKLKPGMQYSPRLGAYV